jgi:prepilin-type N-terminal cleavage/methylation domain-containing protein
MNEQSKARRNEPAERRWTESIARNRQAGFSILELMVVLAIVGVLGGIAVPRFVAAPATVDAAASTLNANLRLSRAQAVGGASHYRLAIVDSTTYTINRLVKQGNSWVVDGATPTRTFTLPRAARFTSAATTFEFDTRGTRISANTVATITLRDSVANRNLNIQVWPSGQINTV